MLPLKPKINSESKSSSEGSDGIDVLEERWHKSIEAQIRVWKEHAALMSIVHNGAGYYYRYRKFIYGMPAIMIPAFYSPFSVLVGTQEWGSVLTAFVLACTAMFTGILHHVAPGEKMEKHFHFAARYADVVSEIDAEMIRYRQFREAADVFITKIKMSLDHLAANEPVVPMCVMQVREKAEKKHEDTTNLPA